MKTIKKPTFKSLPLTILLGSALAGCGFQTYSPKPISAVQSAANYHAHDPHSREFQNYLIEQGYTENQLPIKQWGLRELTLCALFFHPQLDVARAQWHAAQAGEVTAGERLNPNLNTDMGHHSQSNSGSSPWTFGLRIDVPIRTANKRAARIERAVNLSEAARIDIAQTAWIVRNRLAINYIDYNAALQRIQVLQKELDIRNDIVAMLEKRLSLGMISSTDVSFARIQRQKTQQTLDAEQGRLVELRAALANSAGLSAETFNQMALHNENTTSQQSIAFYRSHTLDDAQTSALLNRLDIRAALARYAAAEAKLKLEIARQYPDISLTPGFTFDQGDKIWSLGLSALLSLVNKNEGLIAEAKSLREVEAAQFEALQARVIGDLELAKARYFSALDEEAKVTQLLSAQEINLRQLADQFEAGHIDRLEFTTAKLENITTLQNMAAIQYKIQHAANAIEDVMQLPLNETNLVNHIEQTISKDKAP